MRRRELLSALPVIGWKLWVQPHWVLAAGERPPGSQPPRRDLSLSPLVTPEADQAIQKGMAFLAKCQKADGSFGTGQYESNVAITALAGLAMISNGSTPGEGPHGEALNRIVDFLLKSTSPSGFMAVQASATHGPMYSHGFGTMFLAEAYGMTQRSDIREKLKKAVQLIVYTQNEEGGWRYKPQKVDQADISVSICQIMALRAARNAGIYVPKSTVDRCTEYVKKSQNPDGGFRYMMNTGNSAFPRSAAGVVALYSAGIYEGREVDQALEYLMQFLPGQADQPMQREYHYFYGHYYAVQAMYTRGGEYWERWYAAIRDELISRMRPDGSWYDSICPEYGTAMALVILQMPNDYLPIFQR